MDISGIDQGFVFQSAKCVRPIPSANALVHHHLIQLTLDRRTRAIDWLQIAAATSGLGGTHAVAWRRDVGHVQLIGVEPPAPELSALRDAAVAQGFAIETIAPREILAEPLCSAARAVWSLRGRRVDPSMRIAMLSALADGPMTLDELCTRVSGPPDPVAAVASLACAGAIHLDLSESFGPQTPVWSNA